MESQSELNLDGLDSDGEELCLEGVINDLHSSSINKDSTVDTGKTTSSP